MLDRQVSADQCFACDHSAQQALQRADHTPAITMQAPEETPQQLPAVPASRVSTVTPASMRLLQDVGAWTGVQQPRSASFAHMQVSRTQLFAADALLAQVASAVASAFRGAAQGLTSAFLADQANGLLSAAGLGLQWCRLCALQGRRCWQDSHGPRG